MPTVSIAEERSKSLLDPTYGWFMKLLVVCGGIIVLYLVVGFIKDQWDRSKARRISKQQKLTDEGDLFLFLTSSSFSKLVFHQNKF